MIRYKSYRKKTEYIFLGGIYLKVGEIRYNSFGTPMKIIGYEKMDKITIEFLDLHKFQKITTYSNFIRGQVKNPYDRTIRGVGYLGDGKYMTNQTLHERRAFGIWCNMIDRCYNEEVRSKYAAYSDCIICDSWQCYQVFRKWYDDNFYNVGTERMHIDKDILYKNNRVYSPETCILVPQRINMLFMHKPNKYNLPNGVKPSSSGKYEAKYNGKYLGVFGSVEEAAIVHNKEKKKVIIQIANEYKDQIPVRVYDALINWIPDYIDYSE